MKAWLSLGAIGTHHINVNGSGDSIMKCGQVPLWWHRWWEWGWPGGHVNVGKGKILMLLWAEWQYWGHLWKWWRLSGSLDISVQAVPLTVSPKDRPECPQWTNKSLAFHKPCQPAGQPRAAAEIEIKSQACRRTELTYWNHSYTATPFQVYKNSRWMWPVK